MIVYIYYMYMMKCWYYNPVDVSSVYKKESRLRNSDLMCECDNPTVKTKRGFFYCRLV